MNNEISTAPDKAGIASAVLCTVHCLIVPILFLIKFQIGDNNIIYKLPSWWEQLDYVFLLVSFLAVYHAARHSKQMGLKVAFWIFWVILSVAILFQTYLHWMAYIASFGLVTTHVLNMRKMKKRNISLIKKEHL